MKNRRICTVLAVLPIISLSACSDRSITGASQPMAVESREPSAAAAPIQTFEVRGHVITIEHLTGDAAKTIWRRLASNGDELARNALASFDPAAPVQADVIVSALPTWFKNQRTLTQNSSIGASISAGFSTNRFKGENTSIVTATDAGGAPLFNNPPTLKSPDTDNTFFCFKYDAQGNCVLEGGEYRKFDLWKLSGLLGCHSHLSARTTHSAWDEVAIFFKSDYLEVQSSSGDSEYVDGCDDDTGTGASCGGDQHPTDDGTYDPSEPTEDCGGNGSSGGNLTCHSEWIIVEVNFDNGRGWQTVWEGNALVCS